jgi:hypothetical protein
LQSAERDEALAWRAASVIMVLVTVVTFALWILGFGPFTDIFDGFIVYLPTAILVGALIFERLRGSSTQAGYVMGDRSPAENKAV